MPINVKPDRKYNYVYVLKVKYHPLYGYEDEVIEDSYAEARQRLREYAENCPQYPAKICRRRTLREQEQV